jgi:NAD(P)-dependent dehydrogenase (short-subunit alcohol dehydrogenase family)
MTGVPGRLGQKVAVVTGGGSGIGRAAAIRFAGEGARVLVADIDADHAGAVAGEISAAGGRAAAMAVDVSDPAQVEAMAARAVAEFGGIDILMTAAGVLSFGSATETDPDAWNRVVGINLTGTFLAPGRSSRRWRSAVVARSSPSPPPPERTTRPPAMWLTSRPRAASPC